MTPAQIALAAAILKTVNPVTDSMSATGLDNDRKKRAALMRKAVGR